LDSRQLVQHFEKLFGQTPRIFRAPGRVNLIGEHTDYNDGFVMPAAVGFSTYVATAQRSDRKWLIRSEEFPEHFEFDLDRLPDSRTGHWCDYMLGIARVLRQRGYDLEGANLLVHGEVPIGAGLSSSAAIEVATALAVATVSEIAIPLPEIAKLCRQAENEFVGARVGIMDQFVSCMAKKGQALLLDCRSLAFQFVPIPSSIRLVVCNTMVKHDLATSAYNTRRDECEQGVRYFASKDPKIRSLRDVSEEMLERYAGDLPAVIQKRCTHVVRENQRTIELSHSLAAGDWPRVGQLMSESHDSLRDLYEVSCRELDIMVDAAEGLPGFIGGRMTGGGFGGCTVNLVRENDAEEFTAKVAELYRKTTGIVSQTYLCVAGDGASEVSWK
jgi:galactokinase